MGIFNDYASPEAIEEQVRLLALQKMIQESIAYCLSPGATVVETPDPKNWVSELSKVIDGGDILCEGILAERLKQEQGRQIIKMEAKSFRKDDAIDSMFTLFKLPKESKPIVIIENIADIPDGDPAIYDNPVLVESTLLHSWKSDIIHLTHPQNGAFELHREDYTVLFPIMPGGLGQLHSRLPDGIGLLQL